MSAAIVLSLHVRTLTEAHAAARRAAALCARPQRAEPGLYELLVNAIEHGNLEIGHALKTELRASGQWEAEVARRLASPGLGERRAQLAAWRTAEGWCFEIADAGRGFDWLPWLALDPVRSRAPSGRGIALARALHFDRLEFLPPGSRVRAHVHEPSVD
nr:ATP-binding protein [Pseudothauera rhizosphaerae]